MCTHLKNCQRQPQDVCKQAYEVCVSHNWIKGHGAGVPTPSLAPSHSTSLPLLQIVPDSDFHHYTSSMDANLNLGPVNAINVSDSTTAGSWHRASVPNYFPQQNMTHSPFFDSYSLHSQSGTPVSNPPSVSPSPGALPMISLPHSVSGSPAPLLLDPAHSQYPTATRKRARTVSHTNSSASIAPVQSSQWSNVTQERFETHLANITASCGLSSNWIENQAIRDFFNEILPSASHISSYQLSHWIIPREVEKHRDAAINRSRDQYVMLQTDGWTGGNFHHLIAFMITTARREVGV